MRWVVALVGVVALAPNRPEVGDRVACPAFPVDGATCPSPGLVCRYPKRGFLCECEPKRAVWRCGELGE